MLKNEIIEPSKSPWRAQVLVTSNESKKRLVVDYSQTINRFTYLDAYPLPRLDKMVESISEFEVYSTLDLKSAYHQVPLKDEDKPYTAFEACGELFQFRRIPFGVTNGVACFQRILNNIISAEKLKGTFAYIDNVAVCGHDQLEHDANLRRFLDTAAKYGLTFNDSKSIISVRQLDLLGYRVSKGTVSPDPERLAPLRNMQPPTSIKSQQRIVGMFAYYSHWISHFSDKIRHLTKNTTFPLPPSVFDVFHSLKKELEQATLVTVDQRLPLTVETDASDFAISATLNQEGRPVAFFSRTLNGSERKHSSVEKEAYAIVEATRKWRHFLANTRFRLVTDQKSVAFIYDTKLKGKVKNDKIQRWKIELSSYDYDVVYRPGIENHAADALSRAQCGATFTGSDNSHTLKHLHEALCHPGVTRMYHFVKVRNLPYSVDDVREMTSTCSICAEVKPRFYKKDRGTLVKATQPFERLSLDFKGPVPSETRNKYFLTVVDEYSRFPFAFPCPDTSTATVKKCLCQLFALFGMPAYIHSDRGSSFMSEELRTFLNEKGIATSRTTPYNPQSNGQAEKTNGTIWKAITLALKSKSLEIRQWELVLPDALHSIRSLLCTATNETPHERLLRYNRRSSSGNSIPTWLSKPGPVYLKRNVRASKYDPLVDEVDLIEANNLYAHVRLRDGRESTVSLRQLAPVPAADENGHDRALPDAVPSNVNLDSSESILPMELTANPQPSECLNEGATSDKGPEESKTTPEHKTPFIRTRAYQLRSGNK